MMSPLSTELQKPHYSGLTNEQIVAQLNSQVDIGDKQAYTWAGVADLVGPEASESLRLAFETNGLGWASLQLGGQGLSLADPRVQTALKGFASKGVPGAAVLAEKGSKLVPLWETLGLSKAPTTQEITTAKNITPDSWSKEVLLSVNQQADGTIQAVARITTVGLQGKQVVVRGETKTIINDKLLTKLAPLIQELRNGS